MKKYSKREFLKLMGSGTVGLLLWQCYEPKKESVINSTLEDDSIKNSIKNPKEIQEIVISDSDVFFVERNDEKYNTLRKGFNSRFDNFPKIIAVCLTTKGVQAAINKAKQENLKVSVKSGGHSFEAFSCGNDTLLVNLSNMKKIEWLENDEVKIQPAATLSEIYDEFLPKNKIIPAGSCGSVGIGGLTLGGGYGFFSRKMGLTCDNLTRVKMVDGNGEIQDSAENPEVLWACGGGGNGNFGVVTELQFKTQNAPKNFSSYRLKFRNLTAEKYVQLSELWFNFTQNIPDEAFSAFVLNGKSLTLLITNFNPHSAEFETTFSSLTQLSDEYKSFPNQALATALKKYYGVTSPIPFKNASAGLYKDFNDVSAVISQIFEKVSSAGLIYQINTLGGKINDSSAEKNSSYPHRGFNYLSELQAYWEEKKDENRMISTFQEIQQIIQNHGISRQYRNYPDVNFPRWEEAYYGKNYSRLQEIKRKLDPNDLFHFAQSVRL